MNTIRRLCTLTLVGVLYSFGCSLPGERLEGEYPNSSLISLEQLPSTVLTAEERAALPEGTKIYRFLGDGYEIRYPEGGSIWRLRDGSPWIFKVHGGII